MRRRLKNFLAATLVFSAAVAGANGAPHSARAEAPLDYPIKNGHFFAQAVGDSSGEIRRGFSVTNEDGIPFWDAFQQLGGVDNLGYPMSRRFVWHGQVCQVTQKAILQWNPLREQVELVNILDYLSWLGLDDWLEKTKQVPRPARVVDEGAQGWDDVVRAHDALLDDAPITRAFYFSAPDRRVVFGLPQSRPQDFGACFGVRFQRAALHLWKQTGAGVTEGQITVALAGQIAREAGLFEEAIFAPDYWPPDEESSGRSLRSTSSRGDLQHVFGVATWYGSYFQGRPMRNGEPYDMYDPSITASNVFPLGSSLLVTNIQSGRSIVVRVTDTGAFVYPIVVDLSWAAFSRLANPAQGAIQVTVERLR